MRTYDVWIEHSAERDLLGILRYIAETLKSPQAAQRVYTSIRTQVLSLCQSPERHPVVDAEPYASHGVRMLPVENYNAFYLIHENTGDVHVFRILYNRRDWVNLLY